MVDSDMRESAVILLKRAIDDSISALGGPISKTITWHMNKKGVFTDLKTWDIDNFSAELEDLVGPGAQMILEDAALEFERKSPLKVKLEKNLPPAVKIKRILEMLR